ncbi:hypothetical protein ABIC71_000935 [Herbaspirillum seropedicae]|uniref:hypothetical protein n=1 Tax=Herbaspirillum seropedicae TaxID=964 RepID=UPI0033961813
MARAIQPTPHQMTLEQLGQALTSKAGCSPLLGEHVARTLLDEFNAMLAQGYELSTPQLFRPTKPGHTTWRVDVSSAHGGFSGALIFSIPTIH